MYVTYSTISIRIKCISGEDFFSAGKLMSILSMEHANKQDQVMPCVNLSHM